MFKNKLLVDYDQKKYPNIPLNDIIVPTIRELPNWYKNLNSFLYKNDQEKVQRIINKKPLTTLKVCPSFIELFKNSFIVKAPCDLTIEITPQEFKSFSLLPNLFTALNHPKSQMGQFGERFINIKFTFHLSYKPTKKDLNLIPLNPIYYNDLPFDVLPGYLNIPYFTHGGYPININTVFPIDKLNDTNTFIIEKGTVLAMLYCPEGIPKLEIDTNLTPNIHDINQHWFKSTLKKFGVLK